jgi:hypothetical protein
MNKFNQVKIAKFRETDSSLSLYFEIIMLDFLYQLCCRNKLQQQSFVTLS